MRVQFQNIMKIGQETYPEKPLQILALSLISQATFFHWIWSWWISKASSFDTDSKMVNLALWQNASKTRYFGTKMAQPSTGALL
jgi:hypothetical protein